MQASPSFGGDHPQTNSGLRVVGKVSWRSHFGVFYETNKDLLDVLGPYFKAGLSASELCLWIIAPYQFVSVKEAGKALNKVLPGLDRYLKQHRISITSYPKWFDRNGKPSISKALARFRKKAVEARRLGFAGLRIVGSPAWVRTHVGGVRFRNFEGELDAIIAHHRMMAVCTFPLRLSKAEDIFDAARRHQFSLIVRNGQLERIEINNIAAARRESLPSPTLEQLTFRQREILQRLAEGQNTKEIAALLGISVKTVEAHRLQLMRRLKIDNVPGLVRFAIRTGLVSAEA